MHYPDLTRQRHDARSKYEGRVKIIGQVAFNLGRDLLYRELFNSADRLNRLTRN